MKLLSVAIASMFFMSTVQSEDPQVRLDHYTTQEVEQLKQADNAIEAAYSAKSNLVDTINQHHGIVKDSVEHPCASYDAVHTIGTTLVIVHHPATEEKDGVCVHEASGEAYMPMQPFTSIVRKDNQ